MKIAAALSILFVFLTSILGLLLRISSKSSLDLDHAGEMSTAVHMTADSSEPLYQTAQNLLAAGRTLKARGHHRHGAEQAAGTWNATVFYVMIGNAHNAKLRTRMSQLNESFRGLVKNLLSQVTHKYWVTIFHNAEMKPGLHLEEFTALWPLTQFAEIEMPRFPGWATAATIADLDKKGMWLNCAGRAWEDEYQLLMAFRLADLWNHPVFDSFDYFMSLDTDMYTVKPWTFDPFEYMQRKQLAYAYHVCGYEGDSCTEHLGKSVWNYAQTHNLIDRLYGMDAHTLYAGNFGVGDIEFFRGNDYQDFVRHIMEDKYFWYRAWRDQSIWPFSLALFAPGRVEMWGGLKEEVLKHQSKSLGGKRNTPKIAGKRWLAKKDCIYTPIGSAVINVTAKDMLCGCQSSSPKERSVEFQQT
jgi:hypothetical protein